MPLLFTGTIYVGELKKKSFIVFSNPTSASVQRRSHGSVAFLSTLIELPPPTHTRLCRRQETRARHTPPNSMKQAIIPHTKNPTNASCNYNTCPENVLGFHATPTPTPPPDSDKNKKKHKGRKQCTVRAARRTTHPLRRFVQSLFLSKNNSRAHTARKWRHRKHPDDDEAFPCRLRRIARRLITLPNPTAS